MRREPKHFEIGRCNHNTTEEMKSDGHQKGCLLHGKRREWNRVRRHVGINQQGPSARQHPATLHTMEFTKLGSGATFAAFVRRRTKDGRLWLEVPGERWRQPMDEPLCHQDGQRVFFYLVTSVGDHRLVLRQVDQEIAAREGARQNAPLEVELVHPGKVLTQTIVDQKFYELPRIPTPRRALRKLARRRRTQRLVDRLAAMGAA